MQLAYEGISYCCEALSEGKVAVQKIKKATDDIQTITKEVKSIWGFFSGLFGKPKSSNIESAAKPLEKKKEVYTTHIPTESEIVQQFIGHLGAFFRNHKKLSEYVEIKYEMVFSSLDPEPEEILELSVYKNELDSFYVKLSGMMRGANVPPQLGPLWDNYNQIYTKVTTEQQKRKEETRIRRQKESDYRERVRREKIELGTAIFVTLLMISWLWSLWVLSFTGLF